MATDYKLIVREPGGTKAMEEITDFLWLSYTRKRNRPGLLRFGLPQNHAAIDVLGDRYQVEVWRRNVDATLDWYRDFSGLYLLDVDRAQEEPERFEAYVPGDLVMLSWRHVLWYAGIANRSTFASVNAETIIKTLVTYNATAAATTAAGRLEFDGAITWPGPVTVEADTGRGPVMDWNCAYDNLLETIYDLVRIANGEFDLVKNDACNGWQFIAHHTARTNRTKTVVFSSAFDNLAQAQYQRRGARITGVVIGGPNEQSAREISSTTANGWTQASHVEGFFNGSNLKTDAARIAAGERVIYDARLIEEIGFLIAQTQALRYGRDYFLGDTVAWRAFGLEGSVVIDEVTVALAQDGRETVQVKVEGM